MVEIYINNIKLKVNKNLTVLQACNTVKIEIPKFCFQENLQIAGNCRMCLVEIENSPKPVASCAMFKCSFHWLGGTRVTQKSCYKLSHKHMVFSEKNKFLVAMVHPESTQLPSVTRYLARANFTYITVRAHSSF